MTIPGFTSTGSKRPEVLLGPGARPLRMQRARGCRVWDEQGTEYLDTVMALGAVALGYGHPRVQEAVTRAVRDGIIGPLAPMLEAEVAEALAAALPGGEAVRFFKTGAEAMAAAVRIARVHTNRERLLSCGYHGWLDWCQDAAGVPGPDRALRAALPYGDVQAVAAAVDESLAAIVVEPLVDAYPPQAWLTALREAATASGAVLVFDEIKTAFRVARGGMAERTGITPDLTVVGKALGNGMPIAAVCGPAGLMEAATRTWISSTCATEYASLAAARAVLDTFEREPVVPHLERVGSQLLTRLASLAQEFPALVHGVRGVAQMSYLAFASEEISAQVAQASAARGLLFKRQAYNYVSLAHTEADIGLVGQRLGDALREVAAPC